MRTEEERVCALTIDSSIQAITSFLHADSLIYVSNSWLTIACKLDWKAIQTFTGCRSLSVSLHVTTGLEAVKYEMDAGLREM
jgi:hypothetical protein